MYLGAVSPYHVNSSEDHVPVFELSIWITTNFPFSLASNTSFSVVNFTFAFLYSTFLYLNVASTVTTNLMFLSINVSSATVFVNTILPLLGWSVISLTNELSITTTAPLPSVNLPVTVDEPGTPFALTISVPSGLSCSVIE